MIKINASILVLFLYIISVNSQPLNKTDSLLFKYWNKILVKSGNSINNYLYSGIDNNLEISYPDEEIKKYNLFLKSNNGLISNSEDGWFTVPDHAGRSFISVFIVTLSSDTLMIGKKEFIVKKIPFPVLKVNGNIIKDSIVVNRQIFNSGDTLKLYFTDDLPESNNWFEITNFTLGYMYGFKYVSLNNEGAVFSPESLELIENLRRNQQLVINVTRVTPTGIVVLRELPLVRFKVY